MLGLQQQRPTLMSLDTRIIPKMAKLLCGSFKIDQGQIFFFGFALKTYFFNISAKIFDVF